MKGDRLVPTLPGKIVGSNRHMDSTLHDQLGPNGP